MSRASEATVRTRRVIAATLRRLDRSATLPAALFFVATLLVLHYLAPHAPLDLDTARDLRIAHECVYARRCSDAGPMSSFLGLAHGALWIHILEVATLLHLSLASIERLVDVMLALGAGAVAFTATRVLRMRASPFLWISWLALSLITVEYPLLWEPSPLPLTLASFHLAFALAVAGGETWAFALAAALLGSSVGAHVATATMAPLLFAASVACARYPVRALLATVIVLVEVVGIDAPGGLAHNLSVLRPHRRELLAVVVAALAVGVMARRRLCAQPAARRVIIVQGAAAAGFVAAVAAGWLITRHAVEYRYFAPIVPAVVLLAAAAAERLRRWYLPIPLFAFGLVACFAWPDLRQLSGWQVRDVDRLARELYSHGSFADIVRHIRGPQAYELLAMLGAIEPPSAGRQETDEDWLVVRVPREKLPAVRPPHVRVLELADGSFAAVVRYVPAVRASWVEVCHDERCVALTIDGVDLVGHTMLPSPAYGYVGIGPLARAGLTGDGPSTFRFRVEPTKTPHQFTLLEDVGAVWSIERASFAVLPRGAGAVTVPASTVGEIVLSKYARRPGLYVPMWLPPMIEMLPNDRAWLEPLLAVTPR